MPVPQTVTSGRRTHQAEEQTGASANILHQEDSQQLALLG